MELIAFTETVVGVQCDFCGKDHHTSSTTFLTFQGNIYRGMKGGLIGPFELDKNDRHYCYPDCVKEVLYLR